MLTAQQKKRLELLSRKLRKGTLDAAGQRVLALLTIEQAGSKINKERRARFSAPKGAQNV